jgi:PTH1 family peptidyl-tRNA hydrolase
MQFYKVRPQDVIVFVDDINLDLGKIRIRSKGSHGGQNGLRDIIKQIGQDFVRVRLGMGPVPPKWDLASFVLSKMTQADMQEFGNVLDKIPGLTEALLKSGLNEAMNRYNG